MITYDNAQWWVRVEPATRLLRRTVNVDLVDHSHQFLLGWVLAKTSHDHSQLTAADVTTSVFVEHLKCLANLCRPTYEEVSITLRFHVHQLTMSHVNCYS